MSATVVTHPIPCERCDDLTLPEVAPGWPIPVPPWPCHLDNIRKAQEKRARLLRAGHLAWKNGDEEAAYAVYGEAERAWDDAIHISDPADPSRSLCGDLGRNLVLLDGPRPDGGSGCWACLTKADKREAAPPSGEGQS